MRKVVPAKKIETPKKPIRVPNTPKQKLTQTNKKQVSQKELDTPHELEAILKVQKIAKEFDAKNTIHRIVGTSASEVLR